MTCTYPSSWKSPIWTHACTHSQTRIHTHTHIHTPFTDTFAHTHTHSGHPISNFCSPFSSEAVVHGDSLMVINFFHNNDCSIKMSYTVSHLNAGIILVLTLTVDHRVGLLSYLPPPPGVSVPAIWPTSPDNSALKQSNECKLYIIKSSLHEDKHYRRK